MLIVEIYKQLFSLIFFLVSESNPIFFLLEPHVDQSKVIVRQPTSDEANSSPGVVDSGCRTLAASWSGSVKVQFELEGFDWPHQTLDLHLLRVDLTPTGFPITRRTSYKRRRDSLDLCQVFLSLAWLPTGCIVPRRASDRLCRHLLDLQRTPVPWSASLLVWSVAEVLVSAFLDLRLCLCWCDLWICGWGFGLFTCGVIAHVVTVRIGVICLSMLLRVGISGSVCVWIYLQPGYDSLVGPVCLAIRNYLVVPYLAHLVHSIKDLCLFLFPNPWGSPSLFWFQLLPQLLSPLVQILALPPLWIHSLVLSRICLIFSLSLAH